jgi:hypothetical protein
MAQEVSHRPVTAKTRVRFPTSPCEICGGQMALGDFSLPVLQFPLMLHTPCCTHQKDKRVKPGNLPKSSVFFSEFGEYLLKKILSFCRVKKRGTSPTSPHRSNSEDESPQQSMVLRSTRTQHPNTTGCCIIIIIIIYLRHVSAVHSPIIRYSTPVPNGKVCSRNRLAIMQVQYLFEQRKTSSANPSGRAV